MLRYTAYVKRKEITLGKYPDLSLADAKADAAIKKREINLGTDPLITRKRIKEQSIKLVDDLFEDWFETDIVKRLKYPNIPKRVYTKDVKLFIGNIPIDQMKALKVREIIQNISDERPTIANCR